MLVVEVTVEDFLPAMGSKSTPVRWDLKGLQLSRSRITALR